MASLGFQDEHRREPTPGEGHRLVSRSKVSLGEHAALLLVTELPPGVMRGSNEAWTRASLHVGRVPLQGGAALALVVFCKGTPCPNAELVARSLALD